MAMFPPVGQDFIDGGCEDFARRRTPILNLFNSEEVRFVQEVRRFEIDYDL
jgi:hypothetical protein